MKCFFSNITQAYRNKYEDLPCELQKGTADFQDKMTSELLVWQVKLLKAACLQQLHDIHPVNSQISLHHGTKG